MDDRVDHLIKTYTLDPEPDKRLEINDLLKVELRIDEIIDHEYMKTLCILLFSIANVVDSLIIWEAKRADFDAFIDIDIELLCGAGLEETKQFLQQEQSAEAMEALEYLTECEQAGNFDQFRPSRLLDYYRPYYGI